jgi:hypothetical protein
MLVSASYQFTSGTRHLAAGSRYPCIPWQLCFLDFLLFVSYLQNKNMKQVTFFILVSALFISCNNDSSPTRAEEAKHTPLEGTWQLISGTTITKGDTVTTDYTKSQKMIKIINATHFAFLLHDINKGKDTAIYSSGGGTYTLSKDQYTEHLDYCNDRNWEGHSFPFTVSIKDDTLIQTGIEKVESAGVDRMNIEKYKRIKN